jgi:GNAT superfamily N-acetyltransferase
MNVVVKRAAPAETSLVADILREAAAWADSRGGDVLWQLDELDDARLADEVDRGEFFLAWYRCDAAGTIRLQFEDPEFWPDDPGNHAAYVHRLAVRRRYAGAGVSTALLGWAVEHAAAAGRQMLRLDCDVHRRSLRAVYERFGFQFHSDRRVGPYLVARYEYRLR